jgi:mRNA-degrading endonuclease RelE of RelBE toxin-antitoxin system
MRWGLVITNPAARDLRGVEQIDLNHINDVLEEMCSDPYQGDVKFLRGSGGALHRRVGDWRILFELDRKKQLIVITGVRRRTSNTY